MTQSGEIIVQLDNKVRKGVVHSIWAVQGIKDVLDKGKELHQEATREI